MMGDCVVDASVGVKLFISESGSPQAETLFRQLTNDDPSRIFVPDLFYAECANVLWKYARFYEYPPENASQDVQDLSNLALQSISTADLIRGAMALALEYRITIYDACYAAAAERLGMPLVTADDQLRRDLDGSGIELVELEQGD
jgi:predicted nucleic acid-binding protein